MLAKEPMDSNSIEDLVAMFSRPTPKDVTWAPAVDAAMYRMTALLFIAQNVSQLAHVLCRNGQSMSVLLEKEIKTSVLSSPMSITFSSSGHSVSDIAIRRLGFPSGVVSFLEQDITVQPPRAYADVKDWAASLVRDQFALLARSR